MRTKKRDLRTDVLRCFADFDVWTADEMADHIGITSGTMAFHHERAVLRGLVERVSVGRNTLYALTEKGKRTIAVLPALDPNEVPLPLAWILPQCPECGSVDIETTYWVEERGYGALYQHKETWCSHCDRLIEFDVWDMQQD